jgi:DNA-binding transcriptional LysR family regulator
MVLRQLRYFLAIAEVGHFGRAASRLHIVQPALSMQIRALEEALGALLFKRTSRGVELTEAGALLRVEAERTIAQAERAKLVVQRSARGEFGSDRRSPSRAVTPSREAATRKLCCSATSTHAVSAVNVIHHRIQLLLPFHSVFQGLA